MKYDCCMTATQILRHLFHSLLGPRDVRASRGIPNPLAPGISPWQESFWTIPQMNVPYWPAPGSALTQLPHLHRTCPVAVLSRPGVWEVWRWMKMLSDVSDSESSHGGSTALDDAADERLIAAPMDPRTWCDAQFGGGTSKFLGDMRSRADGCISPPATGSALAVRRAVMASRASCEMCCAISSADPNMSALYILQSDSANTNKVSGVCLSSMQYGSKTS